MNKINKIPRVVAITGGKGGVGKTSISVNLSIALSRMGSKVCLLDGDTSLANINIMLGLYPAYTLEHLFTGEKSIQDIVLNGPEGIQIIPGASGFAQCVDLDVGQQQRLVSAIKSIEPHYDYMLVDTAAGISPTVLHFIAASQVAVLVITPEPTSLTDAFSLLKVLRRRGYRRKVQVIVNMASSSMRAEKVFRRFSSAVVKYLDLKTEYLGAIWMDESMRTAVTLQRPVALYPKDDPSARCFYRLAERMDDVFNQPRVPKLAFSAYWQKLVERQRSPRLMSDIKANQPDVSAAVPLVADKVSIDAAIEVASIPMTQVQKQQSLKLRAQEQRARFESSGQSEDDGQIEISGQSKSHQDDKTGMSGYLKSKLSLPGKASGNKESTINTLEMDSEAVWIDLRIRMNKFFSNENTTPEQLTTLLSSCIYSFGDRLGGASVDLLHGLIHSLKPDMLSHEQKQLLLSDYEYLGLDKFKQGMGRSEPILESVSNQPDLPQSELKNPVSDKPAEGGGGMEEAIKVKERYDVSGFGSQQGLAEAIRNASEDIPLESLLESIKYASLVESSKES